MRLLVDECTGPVVAQWLRNEGHTVFSIYDDARGLDDESILQKAFNEDWILITNDKDFGEKVYRENFLHRGIVFLRLDDERAKNKIDKLRQVFENFSDRLHDSFVVVTENKVRFGRNQP
jgi:predicted nuclease of predicted toxin-antitoxin system